MRYREQYEDMTRIEWSDPDENDGDWPYPTEYVQRIITGPLADAVRARVGVSAETPVKITEAKSSGGYSEYTQETDYEMTIACGPVTKEFNRYSAERNFADLLKWLDEWDGGAR